MTHLSNCVLFLHIRHAYMKTIFNYNPQTDSNEEVDVLTEEAINHNLIVWNDEVNTFDWVIDTLMDICGHEREQAEQCAMLIHTKGKYAVKNGSYEALKPQQDGINDRLINATIE
jgi:ATP-dependent Clp protease adaptor protein ClpS